MNITNAQTRDKSLEIQKREITQEAINKVAYLKNNGVTNLSWKYFCIKVIPHMLTGHSAVKLHTAFVNARGLRDDHYGKCQALVAQTWATLKELGYFKYTNSLGETSKIKTVSHRHEAPTVSSNTWLKIQREQVKASVLGRYVDVTPQNVYNSVGAIYDLVPDDQKNRYGYGRFLESKSAYEAQQSAL